MHAHTRTCTHTRTHAHTYAHLLRPTRTSCCATTRRSAANPPAASCSASGKRRSARPPRPPTRPLHHLCRPVALIFDLPRALSGTSSAGERAVELQLQLAAQSGRATLLTNTPVARVTPLPGAAGAGGVLVETAAGEEYTADKAVVAAGPWISEFMRPADYTASKLASGARRTAAALPLPASCTPLPLLESV